MYVFGFAQSCGGSTGKATCQYTSQSDFSFCMLVRARLRTQNSTYSLLQNRRRERKTSGRPTKFLPGPPPMASESYWALGELSDIAYPGQLHFPVDPSNQRTLDSQRFFFFSPAKAYTHSYLLGSPCLRCSPLSSPASSLTHPWKVILKGG